MHKMSVSVHKNIDSKITKQS